MTTAADFVAALLAGKPAPVVERHTGMPYGWGLWLRALKERLGTIERELAEAIVYGLAQRAVPAPPRPAAALGRWQSFRSLFYQEWGPPPREERLLRWFAAGLSVLMHVLFLLLLAFLAWVNLPPRPSDTEESRVQVEFIGQGTPEDEGGGPPSPQATAQPSAAAESAPSPAASAAAASTPQASPLPQAEVEQPAPLAPQQAVQVTEAEVPTSDFVLPPTTLRAPQIAPAQVRQREIGVPTREVTIVEVPPAQREVPQPVLPTAEIPLDTPEVRQREVSAPLSPVRNVQLPTRTIAAPELRAPTQSVRQAEIAMPSRAASTGDRADSTSPAAAPGSAAAAASAQQGTQSAARAAGSGSSANRPGATPTPARGDDWGASTRNSPGTTGGRGPGSGGGLFNPDGSVRVPDGATGSAGAAGRPGAPGSKQAQRADADRASKWLDRPDFPYEPTMFDKYWRPSDESLLGEWVRRAIKEVEIPIPGTSKKVKCVVSVLQAGGACSLFDPNLNEQPATARPPPDIPVKRNPIPTDS